MLKIAVVHDWLVTNAGAEKVLKSILEVYPNADVYSLVDFLSVKERSEVVHGKNVITSFIQNLPFSKKFFRHYLPLFPCAIGRLDVSNFNIIISSSWAVAKGVKTNENQLHICYCHTPIRYAWDLYAEYTSDLSQPKKVLVEKSLAYIKKWDLKISKNVNFYIANSEYVAERIQRTYKRDSTVINPPVNTKRYALQEIKEEFYFTASRLVPYKKTKLIVEAFNENGKTLVVAGAGEQLAEIQAIAKKNITILGYLDEEMLCLYMQRSKAFVFMALEDFGIIPVEAMSCGTPVVAYDKGGITDSVINGVTGTFFDEQSVESLNGAIEKFETMTFDHAAISEHASKFSTERFEREIKAFVDEKWEAFSQSQ